MRVIKSAFLFMGCIGLAVATLLPSKVIQGASPGAAAYDLPANSWQIPFAPNNDGMPDKQTMNDFYEFAWQSFIALNWPVLEVKDRGQPDRTKMIGASGSDGHLLPVVWSKYKLPSEVFLANAAAPGNWNDPPPSFCKNAPRDAKVLRMAAKDQPNVISGVNHPGFPESIRIKLRGPVVDQMLNYLRYEIRLNHSEFEYFKITRYYDKSKQIEDVQNSKANPQKQPVYQFPPKGKEPYIQKLPPYAQQGSIELMAAWRILNPKDNIDRYYHIPAYIDNGDGDCKLQTVGLVGLHILRVTPGTGSTWIWATFEHVDNVEVSADAPKRPDGRALTPSLNPGPNGDPPPPYLPGAYFGNEPKPVPPNGPISTPTAPNNISRLNPISPDVRDINQKYQRMLNNTVWQNYELVGSLNPYVTGSTTPQPKFFVPYSTPPNSGAPPTYINSRDLSNTTMEAYVQSTNCIICHAYALPFGAIYNPKDTNQFQSFTFLLRLAQPGPVAVNPDENRTPTLKNENAIPTLNEFDNLPKAEQEKILSEAGPLLPTEFSMNDISMRVFVKGNWPLLVAYTLNGGPALITIIAAGVEPLTQRLNPGENQEVIIRLPDKFGERPQVAKLTIKAQIGANNSPASFTLNAIGIVNEMNNRVTGRFGSFQFRPFKTHSQDDTGPDNSYFMKPFLPMWKIDLPINNIHLRPDIIRTSQQENVIFKFLSKTDYNGAAAEFFLFKLNSQREVVPERVFSQSYTHIRANEEAPEHQWDGKKRTGEFSYGLHRLEIRTWRGLRSGGAWFGPFFGPKVRVEK